MGNLTGGVSWSFFERGSDRASHAESTGLSSRGRNPGAACRGGGITLTDGTKKG